MMRWLVRGAYGLVALIAFSTLAFAVFQPIKVLPRAGLGPGILLQDQEGRTLSSDTLRGKIVLYSFGFSRCETPCQGSQAVMQAVQRELQAGTGSVPVQLVTISFDPATDTPAVLRRMSAQAGADPAHWLFTTGEPRRLKYAIGGGFSVYYGTNEEGSFDYDPAMVLIDGWGILRAEYRTPTPKIETVLRDVRLLVEEAQNSTGVARYAYEAAHLFLCYP